MKKTLKLLSNLIGFTGLWTALPIYFLEKQQILPVTTKQAFYMTAALSAWIILNNLWSIACEGKKFSEFQVGDGLIPDTGLKKDSPQKAALREMMGNYLKENNVKIKDGIDVNSIMREF